MEKQTTRKKLRVRIIHKSKDGLMLDFKGEIGVKKTTWEEFNKIFQVCEDNPMFAEPTDEHQKKLDLVEEHINNAVVHFVMSGGYAKMQSTEAKVTADEELMHMMGLGSELQELEKLTGMNIVQISQIVRQRVIQLHTGLELDAMKEHQREARAQRRKDWEERHQPNPTVVHTSTNSLGDNPLLKQLKEKMDSENLKNTEK